jgi:hypothetical protein
MDNKKVEFAKLEHIQTAVNRAKAMLERAKVINKAQYAHGINSTIASIEWFIHRIENKGGGNYDVLNRLHDCVMKLGGYIYSLKEGI